MDQPTAMRCQATALMTLPGKQMLDASAAKHKESLSVILCAGHYKFESMPYDEQAEWIEFAKQESKKEIET